MKDREKENSESKTGEETEREAGKQANRQMEAGSNGQKDCINQNITRKKDTQIASKSFMHIQ